MGWEHTCPGLSAGAFSVLEGIAGPCSVLCYAWLVSSAGLFPLGGQTEAGVQVISFLPRGWLCEGASREEENRDGAVLLDQQDSPPLRVTAFLILESEEAGAQILQWLGQGQGRKQAEHCSSPPRGEIVL